MPSFPSATWQAGLFLLDLFFFFLGRILPSSRLSVFSLFPHVRNALELEYLLIILCKTHNSPKTLQAKLLPGYFSKFLEHLPAFPAENSPQNPEVHIQQHLHRGLSVL